VLTKNGTCTLTDVVIVDSMIQIYFPNLAQHKNLLLPLQLKPKKEVIAINTPHNNSSF
jgi:hypothetical protein